MELAPNGGSIGQVTALAGAAALSSDLWLLLLRLRLLQELVSFDASVRRRATHVNDCRLRHHGTADQRSDGAPALLAARLIGRERMMD